MVATVTKGEGLLVDKLLPHPHSPGQQPSLWPPALTSVFLGFPELQAAVLQLGEDLGNAENVPLSPGTGHHHPPTPPSAPRPGPRRGGQLPPLLRLVKDPNRPAQAAGRAGGRQHGPVIQAASRGWNSRKLSPRERRLPCP